MIYSFVSNFAAACSGGNFFLFPTWHKYLNGQDTIDETEAVTGCVPKINSLSDVWLIVAAIIEILLRVAAIAALVFVIIGAVSYITSQGQPEKTAKARQTILFSLGGLVLSVSAAALVTFIAGRFH